MAERHRASALAHHVQRDVTADHAVTINEAPCVPALRRTDERDTEELYGKPGAAVV